jgi:hypothetical protein
MRAVLLVVGWWFLIVRKNNGMNRAQNKSGRPKCWAETKEKLHRVRSVNLWDRKLGKASSWTLQDLLKMVSCTCNPSYSGGRDQEDQGSKLAWANSS